MNFKTKVITLSIVLVALIIAYSLGSIFSKENVQKRATEETILAGLGIENVESIDMNDARLVKDAGGVWKVSMDDNLFPADSEKVGSLLSSLAEIGSGRIASSDKENWDRFEVSDTLAQRLLLSGKEGKPLFELYFGKTGVAGRENYIRLQGDDRIFLVENSISFYLGRDSTYWSDLRFFPSDLKGSDIQSIDIKAELVFSEGESVSAEYSIFRESGQSARWRFSGGSEINTLIPVDSKIDGVANSAASLRGAGFSVQTADSVTGLGNPGGELIFTTGDGQRYRVLIGNPVGEKRFYARIDGRDFVYEVSEWSIRAIFKAAWDLAEKDGS